jgi:hypothetical protein
MSRRSALVRRASRGGSEAARSVPSCGPHRGPAASVSWAAMERDAAARRLRQTVLLVLLAGPPTACSHFVGRANGGIAVLEQEPGAVGTISRGAKPRKSYFPGPSLGCGGWICRMLHGVPILLDRPTESLTYSRRVMRTARSPATPDSESAPGRLPPRARVAAVDGSEPTRPRRAEQEALAAPAIGRHDG